MERQYPHHKSTQLIASSAEAFHVGVDAEDTRNWSAAFTMAKVLDTLVDEDHIYDTSFYTEQLLAGSQMPYLTEDETNFVRETYRNLSETSKERWQNAATKLGNFALKRLEAETVGEYIEVISTESILMSDVLKVENTLARPDYPQREIFNVWLEQMGRTAYAVDTLSDLIRDHNEGNMNIQPNLHTATALARHSLKEFVSFARITPMPVYGAILQRGVTKSFEKLRQPNFMKKQFIKSAEAVQ